MARSNFKVFAEGAADKDVQSDVVYNADTQRIYGVVPELLNLKCTINCISRRPLW